MLMILASWCLDSCCCLFERAADAHDAGYVVLGVVHCFFGNAAGAHDARLVLLGVSACVFVSTDDADDAGPVAQFLSLKVQLMLMMPALLRWQRPFVSLEGRLMLIMLGLLLASLVCVFRRADETLNHQAGRPFLSETLASGFRV